MGPDNHSTADDSPLALDARRLRGLAHPTRVRILNLLEVDGPATATLLADRLHLRSGSTSWHLAKLAEHGLVEEIPDRGSRRERWWKSVRGGWTLAPDLVSNAGTNADPELAEAAHLVLTTVMQEHLGRVQRFLDQDDWSEDWLKAWFMTTHQGLVLDPGQLRAMLADLGAVLERYGTQPSSGEQARRVSFQMQAIPLAER